MNNQAKLLSKVIQERDLSFILENNIQESWFTDATDNKVFRFLRDHFNKYQECPSIEVVKDNFPTYELLNVEDSVYYLVDNIVEERRKQRVITTLTNAIESLEKNHDHEGAIRSLELGLIKLEEEGLNRSNRVEITAAAKTAISEYEHRKNNPGLLGIPTGFPTMDEVTSGLQPGQLIVIIAPPKTGKSTLALQMAINAHMEGKVPMFYSFEMSNEEQKSRYYSMRARISHRRLMTGSLSADEESRYYSKIQSIQSMRDKFFLVDSSSGQTVSGISSVLQTANPDILFIDGTYLMIDEQTNEANTPQALTNITRSLKRLAQKSKKPIVITTQVLTWKMKKGSVSADAIGYSSSFHQDADVIFGLQREDEAVDDTRLLKVVASRNSGLKDVSLNWSWETGQFREMTAEDV